MNKTNYMCSACSAENVKLWRPTLVENAQLFCVDCAKTDQNKPDFDETLAATERIGILVEAIPTEDGNTFWAYPLAPYEGVKWWHALPLRVINEPIGELMDADEVAKLITEIAYRNGWVLTYKLERRT